MKLVYIPLLVLAAFIMVSCASIISGTEQRVSFQSEPPGAEVYINGKNTYRKTPTNISLNRRVPKSPENRRNEYKYTFIYPGYNDAIIIDDAALNGLIWLNLVGGPFAAITIPIDLATGSTKQYDSQVFASLNKKAVTTDTVGQKQIVYVPAGSGKQGFVFSKNADVDKNIPSSPYQNPNRYALIIGNEDYSSYQIDLTEEVNVDFARNDASAFKEYAINVLGIPAENMIFLLDATTGQMNQAIAKANLVIKNTKGNADVFIYYAGHGLPDEVTKEAYLMPVDVSGKNASEGILLKTMYEKLTEYPSKRITVFIDACFSGGARNQGLLAARGVKINPKESPLGGNLVVFSASSGEQSSLPYVQKEHGFFTYYLLKKFQETGGQVSYGDLSDYLIDNVSLKSVLINNKEQNPKVSISNASQDIWRNWKLNE